MIDINTFRMYKIIHLFQFRHAESAILKSIHCMNEIRFTKTMYPSHTNTNNFLDNAFNLGKHSSPNNLYYSTSNVYHIKNNWFQSFSSQNLIKAFNWLKEIFLSCVLCLLNHPSFHYYPMFYSLESLHSFIFFHYYYLQGKQKKISQTANLSTTGAKQILLSTQHQCPATPLSRVG